METDAAVVDHLPELYINVRGTKLREVVSCYSTVRLAHLAKELAMSDIDAVEALCAGLILDGTLKGWLDQVEGVLHVEEDPRAQSADALEEASRRKPPSDAARFDALQEWVDCVGGLRAGLSTKVVNMASVG